MTSLLLYRSRWQRLAILAAASAVGRKYIVAALRLGGSGGIAMENCATGSLRVRRVNADGFCLACQYPNFNGMPQARTLYWSGFRASLAIGWYANSIDLGGHLSGKRAPTCTSHGPQPGPHLPSTHHPPHPQCTLKPLPQPSGEAVTLALDLPGDDDHLKAIALAGAIAQLAWLTIDLKQARRQRLTVVA